MKYLIVMLAMLFSGCLSAQPVPISDDVAAVDIPTGSILKIDGDAVPSITQMRFTNGLLDSGTTAMIELTADSSPGVLSLLADSQIHHIDLEHQGKIYDFQGCITDIAYLSADDVVIELTLRIEALSSVEIYPDNLHKRF